MSALGLILFAVCALIWVAATVLAFSLRVQCYVNSLIIRFMTAREAAQAARREEETSV